MLVLNWIKNNMTEQLNVENVDKYVQKLFTNGKLLQVHVGMWSMGCQLEKKDLDLDVTRHLPELFKLGRKFLINASVRNGFKVLEGRARQYLNRNSFNFLAADAHFVPLAKVPDVLGALYDYKSEFEEKVKDFCDNYEKYKQDTLTENKAYRDCLEPFYPHPDKIKGKFYFDVSMFQIALPENVEQVDLQKVLAEKYVTEEVRASAEVKLRAQMEMQKAEMGQQIYGFVGECVKTLRESVFETSKFVAEKIQKGEPINKSNVTSLKAVIEQFNSLNFFSDTEVAVAVAHLKSIVDKDHDFKDNKDSVNTLQTALQTVMQTTEKASDVGRINGEFFRRLEL